jgi:putative ATP-dependent endonuclease of the OLD family
LKLTHVRVKDFRSLAGEHEFDLTAGLNYFVGPNNAGKSNILRAIELALDPDVSYEPARDRPARDTSVGGAPVKTRIVLSFSIGSTGPEATLTRHAQAYETALRGEVRVRSKKLTATFAEDHALHLVTEFGTGGARVTTFQAKGMGARSLPAASPEHIALEKQFRAVLRFAVVHSGEDLESLLKGKFRDILNLVISEHLRDKVTRAEESRLTYLVSLQKELLEPLRAEVEERVGNIFTEISGVELIPTLPSVQETLGSVEVRLVDSVSTALADKGTGIRGAVLVSMLQYLAAQSRRSLVLAVEEPEAFLHPAAQDAVRGELQALAAQSDVTLLITTHSPHIVARTDDSTLIQITKAADGTSNIGAPVAGSSPLGPVLESLYRDAYLSEVLERSLAIPHSARVILITEGYTDWELLSMCCKAAGRPDLIEDIHVIVANKAANVVPQAIISKATTNKPVIALLDFDNAGRQARDKLKSFGWNPASDILVLNAWPDACKHQHDVEIEDLIPTSAAQALATAIGSDLAIDVKERCGKTERWHYKYSTSWKASAVADLRDSFSPKPSQLEPLVQQSDSPGGGMVWLAEEILRRADSLAKA